ncbi:hypothetical protein PENSPDRAFT_162604 [Peniophora sp. CONT]|nr:hypothetical protein PENSPDRAFT_162604 [Peniophora sp. CONT]
MQDTQAPNPCLDVQGSGVIGVPLTSFIGLPLIQLWSTCPTPSPTSTPMYATVPSSALKFRNPRWDDWVSSATNSMIAKLGGPRQDFSCQFEHMMLLGEGFSQKAYIQDEGASAFAHMIIILPGQAEGSDIKVKLNGHEEIIRCRTDNFETSMIAWPADATFEIQPINKGFQAVLSYHFEMQSGATFRDWRETRQIPYSPDRSIDELNIASALWKWNYAIQNRADFPNSLFFMIDVVCKPADGYAGGRFDPFEGSSEARAFVDFLSRLGGELGFRTSLGHLLLTFRGTASTDTDPKWDPEMDDWDEDTVDEHADDVWLESDDIFSKTWMFTPVSGAGILDSANQRLLAAAELLDSDGMPELDDLREPDSEPDYEGWQGDSRYQGEPGTLEICMFLIHDLGMTSLRLCLGYYRAAIQISLL